MLHCVILLIVWAIIAIILVAVVETLLGMWTTCPPQVPVLIRLLALLLLVVMGLQCVGLLGAGMGRW